MNLEVHMFDRLEIISRRGVLDEDTIRSEMETKLLTYFFCHHKRNISIQELSEVLWTEEQSSNPIGALKNLIYRIRNLIKEEWGGGTLILTGKGAYYLNPEITIKMDVDKFESCCRKAYMSQGIEEKIELYSQAAALYKGRFMPRLSGEYWASSLSTYYHSLYLDTVKELMRLYDKVGDYEAMLVLSSKAMELDYLDEELHCYFIQALLMQNKEKLAMEHYHRALNLLYDNLGIMPSQNMCQIHDQIKSESQESELELKFILNELNQGDNGTGALFCEYRFFKNSYNQEVKKANRYGKKIYVALITLCSNINVKDNSKTYISNMEEGMTILEFVLKNILCKGDMAARYSGNQSIIMFTVRRHESAQKVMEMIQERFDSANKKRKVSIYYNLEAINIREQSCVE